MVLQGMLILACSMMAFDPDRIVQNDVVSSPSGQFAAVVRWERGVPDFVSMRAGDVPVLQEREDVTVAVYGSGLIAEISIAMDHIDEVHVSDSGTIVAVKNLIGGCSHRAVPDDPFLTVYSAEGTLVGSLKVQDVFTSSDHWQIVTSVNVEYQVRDETFVLTTKRVERAIDLTTAKLVGPKTDILPKPVVTAGPVDIARREYAEPAADCAAAFYDKQVERIDTQQFFDRAIFRADATFPEIMLKARVRGPVIVDVVVSEDGEVLCTRASQLPFGGPQAAMEAVKQWKFTPSPVKFAGELLFRFEDR